MSGENKTDLDAILDNAQASFLDKVRMLVIMILCLQDLDGLSKYIQTVTEKHPSEQESMRKIDIMFQKRKNIENQKNAESSLGPTTHLEDPKSKQEEIQRATMTGIANLYVGLLGGVASGISSMLTDSNN